MKIPGLYNGTNKTFFMFNGEKYREGTPAAQFSSVPTAAMKNGDFSELVDAQGRPIIIYDPATGRDVNGVWTRDPFPGNIIPANRINPAAKALLQYFPDPNCTTPGQPDWQQNLCYTEHFNKDMFWNWVGKVDHNFSRRTACSSARGRTRGTRSGTRPRSAPARRRTVSCRFSAATMRSSATGCTSSAAARCSTCAAATPITSRAASPTHAFGFDSTSLGWPASLVSQFPAAQVGGMFPVVTIDQFVTLSRGFGPNTNKIFTIQPNISLTRGNHNIRSGLDMRCTNVYNDNYGNAGGQLDFTRRLYPQHAEQHQHARGQRLRVVPARRAVGRQRAGQPVPALLLDLRRAVDPGRLAGHQQADAEPRLPLGLQQPRSRRSRTG